MTYLAKRHLRPFVRQPSHGKYSWDNEIGGNLMLHIDGKSCLSCSKPAEEKSTISTPAQRRTKRAYICTQAVIVLRHMLGKMQDLPQTALILSCSRGCIQLVGTSSKRTIFCGEKAGPTSTGRSNHLQPAVISQSEIGTWRETDNGGDSFGLDSSAHVSLWRTFVGAWPSKKKKDFNDFRLKIGWGSAPNF